MPPREEFTTNGNWWTPIYPYNDDNRIVGHHIINDVTGNITFENDELIHRINDLREKYEALKHSIYQIIVDHTNINISEEEFMQIINEGENR